MINVKYTSSSKSPSGYGEAARNFVTALLCAGVNVTCESITQTIEKTDYGLPGAICNMLENRDIPYQISIIHLTPDLYPTYKEKGIYTIGHLFWETDRLPKAWIKPLNEIDEIWTASPQMVRMIMDSGVTTKCTTFPQPIDVSEEKIEPFDLNIPRDFIFYYIAQWIDRKNFRGLLRAYWKAFEGNDKVSLLLKTYRVNYSDSEYNLIKKDIQDWKKELKLKSYPRVLLARKILSNNQMKKLHMLGDCYVNASSGEGWCRPMQEAMNLGKPVISGDNGGLTDYLSPALYTLVLGSLQSATEVSHIPWYDRSMNWNVLDEEQLMSGMKSVYEDKYSADKKAEKVQELVRENFNFQTVGNQMRIRLNDILQTNIT